MGRKPNNYNQILLLLQELHQYYPSFNMGRHLATALADYPDYWGITDKELLFALTKYKAQMEYDYPTPIAEDNEVARILEEGKKLKGLSSLLDEDEYYG
jgi:hypothetical protein